MLNQAVARRYARAIFDLAQERDLVDQVDQELNLVATMVESNRQLKAVMNDVLISPEVKRDLVERIFAGKVSPLVMNFLQLVVRKRREAWIPVMYRSFLDLANEARGIVEVEVRSAVPLPNETLVTLQSKLQTRFGKRVKFETQVAPELLGGLVVRVGDELMDGSVRTRLRRIHDRMIRSKAE